MLAVLPAPVLLLGDFNMHLDLIHKPGVQRFMLASAGAGFYRHVSGSTHKGGHTLDLLLTREADKDSIKNLTVRNDLISDHYAVHFDIQCLLDHQAKQTLFLRNFKLMNAQDFSADLKHRSGVSSSSPSVDSAA